MEELNKNQLILLALLVSFVTSIATGIVTVTLIDQAPRAVTQTINRIVERTVEKVVPPESQVATVVREVPVIVTEEELIVQVINRAAPAVARLIISFDEDDSLLNSSAESDPDSKKEIFQSGFFISGDYLITAFLSISDSATSSPQVTYRAFLDDGQELKLTRIVPPEENLTLAVFQLSVSGSPPAALTLTSEPPEIGQTVIALGTDDRTGLNASVGILSAFSLNDKATAPFLVTQAASDDNFGGPLLNTRGEVIGLNYGRGLAVPPETIQAFLDLLKKAD